MVKAFFSTWVICPSFSGRVIFETQSLGEMHPEDSVAESSAVQPVLPAYAATTRTALLSATLSSGCISPSDCVSKMTLPEKEGQMTQVEKNAFTMAGNSITDITTYFIGSVLSGGGGGPNGAGGTAAQWADMVDNF